MKQNLFRFEDNRLEVKISLARQANDTLSTIYLIALQLYMMIAFSSKTLLSLWSFGQTYRSLSRESKMISIQ